MVLLETEALIGPIIAHGGSLQTPLEILTMNYLGYSPHTAALLRKTFTDFHEANKDNPNAKYLQLCHSQGALHLRNALQGLPQEIRDRVIVLAIAPAAIITPIYVLERTTMRAVAISSP